VGLRRKKGSARAGFDGVYRQKGGRTSPEKEKSLSGDLSLLFFLSLGEENPKSNRPHS